MSRSLLGAVLVLCVCVCVCACGKTAALSSTETAPPPQPAPLLTVKTEVTVAPAPCLENPPNEALFQQASDAARRGDPLHVRQLLEPRTLAGMAAPKEARLLREACKMMGDVQCAAEVKAMYPHLWSTTNVPGCPI